MHALQKMSGLITRTAGLAAFALVLATAVSDRAEAALVTFQTFSGNVGMSTDGWGGTDGVGDIRASAPSGSTVVAAYLYTSTHSFAATVTDPAGVTFEGTTVTYVTSGILPPPACCNLAAYRADVTSIVKPVIDGGAGGVYSFGINESASTPSDIDGHALVVVYDNPSLPQSTVGILDGFARVEGDSTSINFASPLDPTHPDFFAEMVLGIGFSCCNQASRVDVNGNLLTENAGNFDDGEVEANGSLITVGSFDDPFSPANPTYAEDTERYNLVPFINTGDTSIAILTSNATRDDLIFLAAFHVSGVAGFNEPPSPVPLPAAGWLFLSAIGGLAALNWRRRKAV